MSARLFDGLRVPAKLGGHPALDFANTRAGWWTDTPTEYLHSFRHMVVMTGYLGLLDMETVNALKIRDAPAVLRRALAFRVALFDVLTQAESASAWKLVQREFALAAPKRRLLSGPPARFGWDGDEVSLPLHALAWSAGELIAADRFDEIHVCVGTGCGFLFLDPRGRRRWCTMAVCGNRSKVRSYALRARDG